MSRKTPIIPARAMKARMVRARLARLSAWSSVVMLGWSGSGRIRFTAPGAPVLSRQRLFAVRRRRRLETVRESHHRGLTSASVHGIELVLEHEAGRDGRRHWLTATKQVGVSGLRFHDLRHTAATLAKAAGATTKELMHRMGHSSPDAALRYEHVMAEREAAIAA